MATLNGRNGLNRRNVLHAGIAFALPPALLSICGGCKQDDNNESSSSEPETGSVNQVTQQSEPQSIGDSMQVHYLEIVTTDPEGLCAQYEQLGEVKFSEPEANLGGARTAPLEGGGMLAIRGPLRDTETPVIRPYMLVDDIDASVAAAEAAGAEVAIPRMEIPGHGTCAIVIRAGIECGFWQN